MTNGKIGNGVAMLAAIVCAAALLAGCEKKVTIPPAPGTGASEAADLGHAAKRKLDEAASFVGAQIASGASAPVTASGVVEAARAKLGSDAAAAASAAGEGLEKAGRKLQQWSAAQRASDAAAAGPASDGH